MSPVLSPVFSLVSPVVPLVFSLEFLRDSCFFLRVSCGECSIRDMGGKHKKHPSCALEVGAYSYRVLLVLVGLFCFLVALLLDHLCVRVMQGLLWKCSFRCVWGLGCAEWSRRTRESIEKKTQECQKLRRLDEIHNAVSRVFRTHTHTFYMCGTVFPLPFNCSCVLLFCVDPEHTFAPRICILCYFPA